MAKEAKLDEYKIRVIPKPKTIIELLLADLMGTSDQDGAIQIAALAGPKGRTPILWEAVAPILNRLEPHRVAALRRAFVQLEIMQQERLSLAMPEIVFAP